jgi:hypothetical protein
VITRTEFDFLPPVEKAHTLFEFGDELDVRNDGDFRIKLYLIADFFVELWYSTNKVQISKLVSLSEEDVIDIYSDRIDISGLW